MEYIGISTKPKDYYGATLTQPLANVPDSLANYQTGDMGRQNFVIGYNSALKPVIETNERASAGRGSCKRANNSG